MKIGFRYYRSQYLQNQKKKKLVNLKIFDLYNDQRKHVKETIYISLLMQLITTLISLDGLNYDLIQQDAVLHDILILEAFVQFVEAGFYIWVIVSQRSTIDDSKKICGLVFHHPHHAHKHDHIYGIFTTQRKW